MASRGPKGGRQNFAILSDREKDLLRSYGIEGQRVPVQRGDVILFRSDLAHCGASPIGRRENFRAVVYICMLPAAMTPEHVYLDKRRAYEQLATGSHWPNQEEWFTQRRDSHFAARSFFEALPSLSVRQRLLYGLDRYTPQAVLQTQPSFGNSAENASFDAVATPARATAAPAKGRRWGASRAKEEIQGSQGDSKLIAGDKERSQTEAHTSEQAAATEPEGAAAEAPTSEQAVAMVPEGAADADSMREVRRLQKALREIAKLERRIAEGEELRQNQLQKVQKKDGYRLLLEKVSGQYSDMQ